MSIRTVLVSGAGIGGPTLAYWLHRRGYQVAVIERAPQLRDSGSAVDFRGKQMDILVRTGILDEVRARQTGMGEQVVVDLAGELATRGDDYRAAFAAYERYLRPAAAACAKQARNSPAHSWPRPPRRSSSGVTVPTGCFPRSSCRGSSSR